MRAHIIKVKFVGPTNNRGSRIKLTSGHWHNNVMLDWDYGNPSNVISQAKAYLEGKGFTVIAHGELTVTDSVIAVKEFDSIKVGATP